MKKKKMTADNVEQLLEVVRAIQQGEDPEAAIEAKRAESAQVADSPKSRQKQSSTAGERLRRSRQKKERDGAASDEADAREKNREPEDEKPEASAGDTMDRRIWEGKAAAERLDEWEEEQPEDIAGDRSGPQEAERSGRMLESGGEDDWDDEFERLLNEEEKSLSESMVARGLSAGLERLSGAFKKKSSKEKADDPEPVPSKDQSEVAEFVSSLSNGGEDSGEEQQERGTNAGREPAEEQKEASERSAEDTVSEEPIKDEKPVREKKPGGGRKQSGSVSSALKQRLQDFLEGLQQRGIRSRELAMLGMGAVLAFVILVLIFHAVTGFFADKKKSRNVTADEGLSVAVEAEPESWCSSYPVQLKFRAKGGSITEVTVNGENLVPDENGMVTVTTGEYLLEASAVTESGTLNAQIEIPMLDAAAPVVNLSMEQKQITVTADDGRSGVAKIWYAAVHSRDYLQFPIYQEYSEPLIYEADTVYYFYAQDKAGNSSVPKVTTMEAVQELALAQEQLSLYPGETGYLQLTESPEGALLSNLRFESANETVATVNGSGMVTAVAEGSTLVKVSADGVPEVSCQIEVSSQRTVTVSAIGDCTLGTDEAFNTSTDFNAYYALNGSSYFFRNVKDILENDDVTFANMEGTLTTETTREVKEYAFKGDPSYTEVLKAGSVDVVTLANNHSSDYGAQSLEDTKQYLKEADIDYCIGDTIAMKDVNGIKMAFIGIYVLNDGMGREAQVRETIASAKAQGAQLVITAFHWGSERETQADATQQSLAHIAVDCGADLVVGHHPHVLQGIEKYNGKYIVYSLGNFCFGGNSAPSDMDTMIFRQTFTVSRDGVLSDDQIEIVPCKISSADGYNNYQPTPAEGAAAEQIMDRINEYSQSFGMTYTASSGLA